MLDDLLDLGWRERRAGGLVEHDGAQRLQRLRQAARLGRCVDDDAVADVQALGGDQRRRDVGQVRRDDLVDVLGVCQVLEAVLAEVAQAHAIGEPVAQQLLRGERDEDLAAVADGLQARAAVERRAEVVAVALFGGAGVQAHAHGERREVGIARGEGGPVLGR